MLVKEQHKQIIIHLVIVQKDMLVYYAHNANKGTQEVAHFNVPNAHLSGKTFSF